jgi:ribosome biogenesis GTPase / thiamine phosphate phosphatase
MQPEDLGYNEVLEKYVNDNNLSDFERGRIVIEHKERYIVRTTGGEYEAEITGNMRYTARSREDFPAVGDWVFLNIYDNNYAVIHKILPRFSIIKRQAAGQSGEIQIIAANIDYTFLVQAVDRDFNLNRLERYLTIAWSSNVKPVIVLTKTDLVNDLRISEILNSIKMRIDNVPLLVVSNETKNGLKELEDIIERGRTYCLLGSSGAGKSTLMNNLAGRDIMKTDEISSSTNKGRHITSHRELIILEKGGIIIDNPGMREVGIADSENGLETLFDKITRLSHNCRFKDCTHTSEIGCSVIEAIEKGELDRKSYENYLKLEREKKHFETTVAERRKREKAFGKILKDYNKKDIKGRK